MRLQTMLELMPPPALKNGRTCVTVAELAGQLGEPSRLVSQRLNKLLARGYVRRCRKACFALTLAGERVRAGGVRPRAKPKTPRAYAGSLGERVWTALRRLRKASLPELLELAARDESSAASTARTQLAGWVAAGLVVRIGQREARWLLPKDIGAKAPRLVDSGRKVFDPNAGRLYDRKTGEVVR